VGVDDERVCEMKFYSAREECLLIYLAQRQGMIWQADERLSQDTSCPLREFSTIRPVGLAPDGKYWTAMCKSLASDQMRIGTASTIGSTAILQTLQL
jgi:hypothetical protein